METNKQLDEFLSRQMLVDDSEIDQPSLDLVSKARNKVLSRKKVEISENDIFYLVAQFLNLKVRLSHAMLAVFICALSTMYLTNENRRTSGGNSVPGDLCDMASVNSSTLLPGVNTYIHN